MPDYYYDDDNEKYYKEISKKDFLVLSKYKLSDFNKLKNSNNRYIEYNYILLKFPSWYSLKKKYTPCNYKLANFVKFLWKYKITIYPRRQPDKFNDMGYIFIHTNKFNNNNEIINILNLLFGKDKIIIINSYEKTNNNWKYIKNISKKNKNKIIYNIYEHHNKLYFNNETLKWIHKKLNISIPKKYESLQGSIIRINYCESNFN